MQEVHHRTFDPIAKIVGVVVAESEEEAMTKAWELAGNDVRHGLTVQEIDPAEGFSFAVYKSQI